MAYHKHTFWQFLIEQRPIPLPSFLATALFCLVLAFPHHAHSTTGDTIKIGVLAKRGSEHTLQRWSPTTDYLTTAIPQYSFKIVALNFPQVREAVEKKSIDFLLTNSSYYVQLESELGISRIATMKNLLNHLPKSVFGGVIFTRADRRDLNRLTDLRGKSFSAVDEESLGGWLMALREMRARGINPQDDFRALQFAGTHDAVVYAVLNREADAGTVRTDTLERMAEEGRINLAAVKILNAQPTDDGFNYLHSTRLYPEWPFAKVKHTPEKLAEAVAVALLSMPPQSDAAKIAKIGGWTVPLDYQPIHLLFQDLHLGPYAHHLGKIYFADILQQHRPGAIIIITLFTILLIIVFYTIGLNRKLAAAKVNIIEQLKKVNLAQQSQQAADLNYREIFHGTNEAIFVHDIESGKILDVNKAMEKMYGYSREEALQLSVADLSANEPPYTIQEAIAWIAKTSSEGPQKFEWLAKRKNGTSFWVEVNLKKAIIGSQSRLLAVVDEISERKKYETELLNYRENLEHLVADRTFELQKSEQRLVAAQAIATLGSWEWNITDNTLWWSTEVYRICGLPQDNTRISYASYMECVHPADREIVQQAFDLALADVAPYKLDHRLLLPDGSERVVHEQAKVYFDAAGNPTQMVGTIQNITDRKILEQEHSRLAKAIEQTKDSIVITDRSGNIQYVNPAFEKITGYSRQEAMGKNPRILQSGHHDKAFYQEMWTTLSQGKVWSGHLINQKKDGSLFEEESTISPIFGANSYITSYVAVKRDVTERVELEKQLRQAQKLESIGTLAGGIAHDFNNILTAILGYGEMVLSELPPGSPLFEQQEEIIKAGNRAAELVKQILAFSRQAEQELQPIQMQLIIKEALKLLRASIPTTIEFKQEIDPNCRPVLADPTQIHQVVMNLCTNAYYAMRETGGILGVTLTPVELDPHEIQNKVDLQPGMYARLEISDTGPGMDKIVLDRIFEPYFTTKTKGEGTGLGLSLVHGIIKSIGGDITVYSETGVGTTFHLYFPQIETTATTQQPLSTLLPPGGNEHILVVDDDDTIVQLETRLLESLGYQVTAFNGSLEALQAFLAEPDTFDMLITDMTMPSMTGAELIRNIIAVRPELPIILCTGYSEIISKKKALTLGAKAFVMKPILKTDLANVIRQVFGEK